MNLEFTNKILKNKKYCNELEKLKELEKDRIFCSHDIEHFLNVARITMIMCYENGIKVNPDIIYSAALLHDIGRSIEYTTGISHEIVGKKIANEILEDIACDATMKATILSLIENHRNINNSENSLESLFYKADKKSRLCFNCSAQAECNKPLTKRNMDIEV